VNCAHIAENAGGLVTLDRNDAERIAAFAHAAACTQCAGLLQEAQASFALLDVYAKPVAPDAATMARIRAQLQREMAPAAPAQLWILALLAAVSAVMAVVAGGSGPLDSHLGFHCLGYELMYAGPTMLGALWLVRKGTLARPALALASSAAIGALAGQAALLVKCSAIDSHVHNLAFHTAGVLVAAAVGYALSKTRLAAVS
jgi:hypothetical protein